MTDEIKVQDAGTADKAKLTVATWYDRRRRRLLLLAGWPAWLRWTAVAASLALAGAGAGVLVLRREFRHSWSWRASSCARSCGEPAGDGHRLVVSSSWWVQEYFFWLLDLARVARSYNRQGS